MLLKFKWVSFQIKTLPLNKILRLKDVERITSTVSEAITLMISRILPNSKPFYHCILKFSQKLQAQLNKIKILRASSVKVRDNRITMERSIPEI